jgi:hypothetical protein
VCVDLRDSAFLIKLRTAANTRDKPGEAVACLLTQFWDAFLPLRWFALTRPNRTCHDLSSCKEFRHKSLRSVISYSNNVAVLSSPLFLDIRKCVAFLGSPLRF